MIKKVYGAIDAPLGFFKMYSVKSIFFIVFKSFLHCPEVEAIVQTCLAAMYLWSKHAGFYRTEINESHIDGTARNGAQSVA